MVCDQVEAMEQQLRMERRFLEEQAGEREVRHWQPGFRSEELLDHIWENIELRAALHYWLKWTFESNIETHLMRKAFFGITRINYF